MEASGEEPPKESTANALPPNNISTPESSPALQPPDNKREERLTNKQRREERLKVDKNVEQFMKSLNNVPTLEEKFSLVCKKFAQTSDDYRKLHFYIKQAEKKFVLLEKAKDQLQFEYNKVVLVKSKLENLCRELQKQNKAVKEESLLKIREEEERRKETQSKFQTTLSEISALLQQNNEKNAKLRDDNLNMTEKFKSVMQQYQLREQQVDKMAKQMTLESQLSDAKLQKASLEHQAEKERILAEMEQLKVTLSQYRAKILELQATESALKGQLAVYTDKYDEFQSALVKSNQMFGGFKDQMEKMSKKIQKLEKESMSWKKRWESSQSALLDMCGERQSSEERGAATARQLHHMQCLCRTLQAERSLLLGVLKEHNIERPPLPAPLPAPPPAPAPPPPHSAASNAKVDAMAANCAQLRQSLAHIQSQLTTLSNNNTTAKEEAAKPEKAKKAKKAKNKAEKQAQKAAEKPEVKETESDESPKSTSEEPQPSTSEAKVESEDTEPVEHKIDSDTMDTILHAINMANINLCDLEVDENDDNISRDAVIEEVTDEDIAKLNNIAAVSTVSNKPDDTRVTEPVTNEPETKPCSNKDTVLSNPTVAPQVNGDRTTDVDEIMNDSDKLVESISKELSDKVVESIAKDLNDIVLDTEQPQITSPDKKDLKVVDVTQDVPSKSADTSQEAQISSPKKDLKEVISQDTEKSSVANES